MELQGRVIAQTEPRTGESARGPWKAQDFVIETHGDFPHRMAFSVFGEDRLNRFNIQMGQEISVSFDIDAREYNGRWYNSIRVYDVRPATANVTTPDAIPAVDQPVAAPTSAPIPEVSSDGSAEENSDDLPF